MLMMNSVFAFFSQLRPRLRVGRTIRKHLSALFLIAPLGWGDEKRWMTEGSCEELFRRTFVLKLVVCHLQSGSGVSWSSFDSLVVLAGLAAASDRLRGLGLTFLLVQQAALIATTFPQTLNHQFLETLILAHLCLLPPKMVVTTGGSSVSAVGMIRITIVTVWVYAGLQKAANGYYLNGEMFGRELLFSSGDLGRFFRWITGSSGLRALTEYPTDFSCSEFTLSAASALLILLISWGTVIAEVILPFLLLRSRSRTLAAWSLLCFSIMSTAASGELSFGLTSACALLLWLPRNAVWTFWMLRFAICLLVLLPPDRIQPPI